jgi:phospholipid/cholesterol/gamma-HCH transport system substrate-binding protein
VEGVVSSVDSAVSKIDSITSGVQQGKGILGQVLVNGSKYDSIFAATMQNINTTSEAARLAASRMAENMEALKHNWLFKGYFENRGYWDKAEYQDEINKSLKELQDKIKLINARIDELKKLEGKSEQ